MNSEPNIKTDYMVVVTYGSKLLTQPEKQTSALNDLMFLVRT